MKRICIPHAQLGACQLEKKAHHYLAHVLRCHPGEYLEVFDGGGKTFLALIEECNATHIHLTLLEERTTAQGSVCLMQALLRQPARFEWLLQKATELGVAQIWPVLTERTQPSQAVSEKRFGRWHKILEEAARQSERNHVPKLHACLPLGEALSQQPEGHRLLLLNESETQLSLREVCAQEAFQGKLTVLVGPEGGWTPGEVALAKQQGALSVGLGPGILKSETAGVAVLAILQFMAGQLG